MNNGQNNNFYQNYNGSQQFQNGNLEGPTTLTQDPLNIQNNQIVYEQGYDHKLVDKIVKMPTRMLVLLVIFGIFVVAGIILLIVGEDLMKLIGGAALFMGVAYTCVFIPTMLRNNKMNKIANRDMIQMELSKPHYFIPVAKTYFTDNFLISNFFNKVIARYVDIVWVYEEIRANNYNGGAIVAAQNAIIGNTNVVIVLNNKKKYRIPSVNAAEAFYRIIKSKNQNVIIGKDKEAKNQYKEFKKNYQAANIVNNYSNGEVNNMNNNSQSDNMNNVYQNNYNANEMMNNNSINNYNNMPNNNQVSGGNSYYSKKNSESNNVSKYIFLAVVLVLGIGFAVYFVFLRAKDETMLCSMDNDIGKQDILLNFKNGTFSDGQLSQVIELSKVGSESFDLMKTTDMCNAANYSNEYINIIDCKQQNSLRSIVLNMNITPNDGTNGQKLDISEGIKEFESMGYTCKKQNTNNY